MIQGIDPRTGSAVGEPVAETSAAEVDRIASAAAQAAPALAREPLAERALRLRAIAEQLESARDELVALADAETGLGPVRLGGELTRTTSQLKLFADVVEEGSLLGVVIDHATGTTPDLRRMLVPIGPVAVFSASNFPFAFSVAGGDTASAIAAGCPVVVKAHPGHPGLSNLVAELTGIPVVHGVAAGSALVTHPAIRAVGFTGSLAGGRALFDLAAGRPDPIPFYGELGSLNPTVVTPGAVAARGSDIIAGFIGSYTLGVGQFCTKPGLLFLPAGHGLDEQLAAGASAAPAAVLLNERVLAGFRARSAELASAPGVREIVPASTVEEPGFAVAPVLYGVAAADLSGTLLEECFGPAAVVVEYGSAGELEEALDRLGGSLTATLHADPATESELIASLVERATARSGRVIWDGWPTGVAVTWAQHHGGPWPATTAPLHTSVGATAVARFQRPVVYQNLPDALLPPALREANPWRLPRRVDGSRD